MILGIERTYFECLRLGVNVIDKLVALVVGNFEIVSFLFFCSFNCVTTWLIETFGRFDMITLIDSCI